jgi:hypothetical protein
MVYFRTSLNHGRRTRMVEHLMLLARADAAEAGIRSEPVSSARRGRPLRERGSPDGGH